MVSEGREFDTPRHDLQSANAKRGLAGPLAPGCPAVLVDLRTSGDAEGPGRDVLRDGRSCRDVGPCADRHRGNQLAVTADERAVLDHRRILRDAIVVAGDRAGADVDLLADRRV